MNKLEQAARALLAKWDAHPYTPWREVGFISGDVANLREALAEQALQKLSDFHQMMEQEPDANNFATTEELMVALGKSPEESKRIHNDLKNLSIAEQAEQEPVAWWHPKMGAYDNNYFDAMQPLYLSPVRTKDLTDDEISKIWYDSSYGDSGIDFARAVIAADREKNK